IFPSAELVRDPFTLPPRIIKIEHRCHRIHAQTVDVVLVEPEQRIADQETSHLMSTVIEDEAAPVLLQSFARVRMLVEMRAIEIREPMLIRRKMRRDPIQDNTDTVLMQHVDEVHQILGSSV